MGGNLGQTVWPFLTIRHARRIELCFLDGRDVDGSPAQERVRLMAVVRVSAMAISRPGGGGAAVGGEPSGRHADPYYQGYGKLPAGKRKCLRLRCLRRFRACQPDFCVCLASVRSKESSRVSDIRPFEWFLSLDVRV